LIPQRLGCQKKYRPPRNYQFYISPIMFGSGWEVGFWKGREGKRRAGGGLFPNFVSLFHFAIFLPCTMSPRRCMCTKMRHPEVRAKAMSQILVNPHLWALPGMRHTECNIPLRKQKIPTQNGIPSHFFGGKFRSVKLVSFTLQIPGHIFMN
jgi:hypothetical protein